jgi:hypothetical protein
LQRIEDAVCACGKAPAFRQGSFGYASALLLSAVVRNDKFWLQRL